MGKGKLILTIDDNRAVSRFVEATLRPLGYRVESAADGIDGLARVALGGVDLILVDFVMPRMNGYHFCKTLEKKGLAKGVPIVLLSSAEERVAEKMMEMTQVVDSLPKPVKAGPLKALVQQLLAGGECDAAEGQADGAVACEDEAEATFAFEELDLETSDSHISTTDELAASLRDRLESAMAGGMAARLDDIVAADSKHTIMGIIGEVVAAVCSEDLVGELIARARAGGADESF